MSISKGKRRHVFDRDNNTCLKCKTKDGLTVDHIVPKSLGGENKVINLQTLCKTCNIKKNLDILVFSKRKKSIAYAEKFVLQEV